MAVDDLTQGAADGPDGRHPVSILAGSKRHLAEHGLDEAVEHGRLVGDVVVEGRCSDAEFLAEPAHAEGFEAFLVHQAKGGLQHPLAVEWKSGYLSQAAPPGAP